MILDRAATLDKIAAVTAEAKANGAQLVVFPETFIPAYPSSAWARFLAGWADPRAKGAYACSRASRSRCPGLSRPARPDRADNEVWLVTGVNERDPEGPSTLYNSLLYHAPDGTLAVHHRKLVPTNHERLIWGQGDGGGLRAVETGLGRIGGLICWENYMPLARFALYESGVEIYIASTADDGDAWQATLVHIARESRSFVISPCHFQRGSSYPEDFPLREEIAELNPLGRGGSAILAPDGSYLAGPLYDEEGILYADLDPQRLAEERQRFDAAGHYHRPDVLELHVHQPVEPVTLVDAENVRRSDWPNIGKEELVELVRAWAEETGSHALVVFDGQPPDVDGGLSREGRGRKRRNRGRPDRARRGNLAQLGRPTGSSPPTVGSVAGGAPARQWAAGFDLVGGGTFARTLRALA